jgi:hypothetical protein
MNNIETTMVTFTMCDDTDTTHIATTYWIRNKGKFLKKGNCRFHVNLCIETYRWRSKCYQNRIWWIQESFQIPNQPWQYR